MTWLHVFFANLRWLRSASSNPAFVHSAPTPAAYGPVTSTETPQKQGGGRISLRARAAIQCNRDPVATETYLTTHERLERELGLTIHHIIEGRKHV